MTRIALYCTGTMADWEYAYITAEIARSGSELVIVGDGLDTVRSTGDMPVTPDAEISAVSALGVDALVLPGADTYGQGHDRAIRAAREVLLRRGTLSAIGGATYLLARAGLLDDRGHTSDDPGFLAPSGYAGAEHYRVEDAVTDDGVITAPGLRPVPFTAAIMRATRMYPDRVIDQWERLRLSR